jgi:hypothetical protein
MISPTKARISLALLILVASCSAGRPDTRALFERYMAAANAHDLDALAAMTHDDVIWQLGPYRLVGKGAALAPHGTDLGMHTTLEVRDITIRGDTVEHVLIERNDATRAYGPDSLVHFSRKVFRDGLLWRQEPWRPSPNMAEFERRAAPFRAWIRAVHPEAYEFLRPDSTRGVPFGLERGQLVSKLLSEWVAAGKPGS